MKLIINTDGGARGNPGPAGIGAVIKNEAGEIVSEQKQYIGETTNNQAEYKALILALEEAKKISNIQYQISNPCMPLEIKMDSELIVKQMNGQYKIKDQGLKPLAEEVLKLCRNFASVRFQHVRREFNKEADRLVNEAIDQFLSGGRVI